MDPCTQGLLGATLACSFAKKNNHKVAAICGFVGGMAPDLDIFIRSMNDQLLFIEYHRHFTHSLAFTPFGGLLIGILLYLILKKKILFKDIYLYTTLGMLTHGLLDACTSYGTTLFWPFSDSRVSWNIISIVDPIFTFILLIFLIFFLFRKMPIFINTGLFLSFAYLLFGYIKHKQVKSYITKVAETRGHKIDRLLLNPTIGNNILWRSVYQSGNNYFVDAIYMPLKGLPKHKNGKKLKIIDKETIFPELTSKSIQREDIKRFSYFSQDYIYLHPDYKNLIADLRYGTLPYDDKSLWGIKVDLKNANKHVIFKNLRNFNDDHYEEFWQMLKGNLK